MTYIHVSAFPRRWFRSVNYPRRVLLVIHSPPQSLLRDAMRSARAGDRERARALSVRFTETVPADPLGWLWRAGLAPTANEALAHLRRLLKIDPDHHNGQFALEEVRIQAAAEAVRKGDAAIALDLFREAADADSDNMIAWIEVARRTDSAEERRNCLEHLADVDPSQESTRRMLSRLDAEDKAAEIAKAERETKTRAVDHAILDALDQPAKPENPRAALASPRPVVLVADGNPDLCEFVREQLEGCRCRVRTANDADTAASKIREDGPPALVLIDARLPGDGFQLCKSLRRNPELKHVKFVLMTRKDGIIVRFRGLLAGFDQTRVKPLTPRVLREIAKLVPVAEGAGS